MCFTVHNIYTFSGADEVRFHAVHLTAAVNTIYCCCWQHRVHKSEVRASNARCRITSRAAMAYCALAVATAVVTRLMSDCLQNDGMKMPEVQSLSTNDDLRFIAILCTQSVE